MRNDTSEFITFKQNEPKIGTTKQNACCVKLYTYLRKNDLILGVCILLRV
jgi:hypothetical protein